MTEPHLDHTAPKRFAISLFPFWISPRLQRAHRTVVAKYARSGPACREVGYNRYWLAEHHNMPGIASSATSVVIGHVAGARARSASEPGHYVAEPRSLGHSRAVRHPGIALSRPDRSRLRSCAGIGSAYIPGASPRSRRRRPGLPGPPRRVAELLPAHFGLVHARQGNSRRRSACTGLVARLQRFQRTAGRTAGASVLFASHFAPIT